jgi:4,5-DOPA dioxygenase extradiol
MAERMPALFIGHGNPMNALLVNPYTQRWASIGATLPKPKAILSVSAHWYIEDAAVTVSTAPRTIHDFGGFPRELYQVQYPAPGDPDLAARVQKLLAHVPVRRDDRWGLDHGTWSVLRHVYPQADIPVVQLSIDETQPPSFHYEVGKRLALLREEGILILGSHPSAALRAGSKTGSRAPPGETRPEVSASQNSTAAPLARARTQ